MAGLAWALLAGPAAASVEDCVGLARDVERLRGIPPGILQSIALVESGFAGVAWPWTLNVGGRPFYMQSRDDAEKLVRIIVPRIGTNIAVGCMQVHLHWHGDRFADLAHLVDPMTNVRYAADFLVSLRAAHGSWTEAVRRYHASDRRAQDTYLCRVLRERIALGYQRETEGVRGLCLPR
jgi:hypothetical protein